MLWTRLCIAYDHSHHPPQIAISVDTDALTATVQIYLNLPIVGLLLSQAMGALKLNSNIEVDFNVAPGGLVSGIAGIKVDTNNDVLVFWDFIYLGVRQRAPMLSSTSEFWVLHLRLHFCGMASIGREWGHRLFGISKIISCSRTIGCS